MLVNEVNHDDIALIFIKSFLGIIQKNLIETLGNIERISESVSMEIKEKIKNDMVVPNFTTEESCNISEDFSHDYMMDSNMNVDLLNTLNHNNLQS